MKRARDEATEYFYGDAPGKTRRARLDQDRADRTLHLKNGGLREITTDIIYPGGMEVETGRDR